MSAAPEVAVVDTGSGNLRSVEKAVSRAGGRATITADPERVARADRVVVPGQGAFGGCVAGLARGGGALREAVLESIARGTPYLGICLGLQVLFEGSDEDPECHGLGLLPGRVTRFAVRPPLKVPHMGWNACTRKAAADRSPALRGVPEGSWFYFVHSYYPAPADPRDVALETDHGGRLCVAVARDNLTGCQFHPEKSQEAGLALLSRFVSGSG
jgi:imidazole glycerol-phosphate synthase subunit HisH